MKYEIRRGQQMLPTGGHHIDAHGRTFKGNDHVEVYEQLIDYRLNNLIPVGDPEQEVLAAYAAHSPWMVDPVIDTDPPPKNDYYLRWRAWVHRMWRQPSNRVITPKEAAFRWAVCETCPHNIKLAVDTSPEGSETLRRAFLLRRGQAVPKKLGFCSLHLIDIAYGSFLETPAGVSGKPKETANYPGCWVV